jgi:hypothetical protein
VAPVFAPDAASYWASGIAPRLCWVIRSTNRASKSAPDSDSSWSTSASVMPPAWLCAAVGSPICGWTPMLNIQSLICCTSVSATSRSAPARSVTAGSVERVSAIVVSRIACSWWLLICCRNEMSRTLNPAS